MKKKSYLLMIIPYLAHYKLRIFISIIFIIGARLLSVANPYIIKKLVDSLNQNNIIVIDKQYLIILVLLFFIFRWGTDVFDGIKDYIFAKVTVGIKLLISHDIFKHLLNLPVEFHTDQATGGVARKITRGTSALSSLSFFLVGNILPTIIEIGFVIFIFFTLFPPIFSLVFLIFVVTYVIFTVIMTNKRQEILLETNRRDDKGSEQSIDALMNYETVKYFTNEKYEFKKYMNTLNNWGDIAIISIKKGANLNMGQGLILTAGLTALLGLAVLEYFNGKATVGDFVLITTYISRISMPLSFLGSIYRFLKEFKVYPKF